MNTYQNKQSNDTKEISQQKQSSKLLDSMNQEDQLSVENKEQTHQSIQIIHEDIPHQQIDNQLESQDIVQQQYVDESHIQTLNKQESFGPKGNNDSGLFFITNPNFKTPLKPMSDEQYNKIQTNPEQYYDNYVEKVNSIKSEILKNQAQIQEGKSIYKRLQIQQESEISKDTKQIEISIEQFLKRLTTNLQEQDQEMRYISKQIDQQTIENQPIIRCLESFENRVYRMEKEIGLIPESDQEMNQQQSNQMFY